MQVTPELFDEAILTETLFLFPLEVLSLRSNTETQLHYSTTLANSSRSCKARAALFKNTCWLYASMAPGHDKLAERDLNTVHLHERLTGAVVRVGPLKRGKLVQLEYS